MIAKHRRNLSLPLQPRQAEERKNQEVPLICANIYLIILSNEVYLSIRKSISMNLLPTESDIKMHTCYYML